MSPRVHEIDAIPVDVMLKVPTPPLPRMFGMLLRDAARGVSSVAETAEGIVDPMLPELVRRPLQSVLGRIEGEVRHLFQHHKISVADIRKAAAFLGGSSTDLKDAGHCADVLAFAWDRTRPEGEGFRRFLSENVTAFRLTTTRQGKGLMRYRRAAEVFLKLRRANVAGSFPGLPMPHSRPEAQSIELRLFAFSVWLLAERASTLDEEMKLLELALALAGAFEEDVKRAMHDPIDLALQFERLSGHI